PCQQSLRRYSHSRPATSISSFFFSNAPSTPKIYTLSLHDALPIYAGNPEEHDRCRQHRLFTEQLPHAGYLRRPQPRKRGHLRVQDRKSTRLNSSHVAISYAVFCLKKKKKKKISIRECVFRHNLAST